jgi:RNA-binding protein YhbY
MDYFMEEELIFSITVETVQQAAIEIIERRLTENELRKVKMGIEWGLLSDINAVFNTAISNVVGI